MQRTHLATHRSGLRLIATACAWLTLVTAAGVAPAAAAPKKASISAGKKYYWSVIGVFPKATLDATIAAQLKPVVLAQVTKTLAAHPQLTPSLMPYCYIHLVINSTGPRIGLLCDGGFQSGFGWKLKTTQSNAGELRA